MKKITVLLADDHVVVRQGLKALISSEEDIEVIAEAETGRQAVQMAKRLAPDIVVMDLVMPALNGFEATRMILEKGSPTKIVILSTYGDEQSIDRALRAGAAAFLMKRTAANDLLRAIREVRRGNAFFSPEIARRIREQTREAFMSGQPVRTRTESLTDRETQVLRLIARGGCNKGMAAELGISIKTIEKHRQQIMNKLRIHEVAGLTRHAVAHGMVECSAPVEQPLEQPVGK
jgi:DNA-binding NarL/FixJ family response regulator